MTASSSLPTISPSTSSPLQTQINVGSGSGNPIPRPQSLIAQQLPLLPEHHEVIWYGATPGPLAHHDSAAPGPRLSEPILAAFWERVMAQEAEARNIDLLAQFNAMQIESVDESNMDTREDGSSTQ